MTNAEKLLHLLLKDMNIPEERWDDLGWLDRNLGFSLGRPGVLDIDFDWAVRLLSTVADERNFTLKYMIEFT